MAQFGSYENIGVELDNHVAVVEIQKPPHNFFDIPMVKDLANAFEALDEEPECRVLVLAAQGKSFCAGANFNDPSRDATREAKMEPGGNPLYVEAVRLFRTKKPVVGAIHGAAIGGGLGVALVPDFRVACPEARFAANFTRLGFHPGFGLTVTLPEVIGKKNTELMFYTSRRFKGEEAKEMGLVDVLVPQDKVREAAIELATEISHCSPLGIIETRKTMRGDLADRVRAATDHELLIQGQLRVTDDFKEGVKAMTERRIPNWTGR